MNIETLPELKIDLNDIQGEDDLLFELEAFDKKQLHVVYLIAAKEELEQVKSALCTLRAHNKSGIVMVKREDLPVDVKELAYIIRSLRDQDQLLLHNIMQLIEMLLPESHHQTLRTEAPNELKWFREWLMASHDPRIHKYPGLPWRSYVRKVNQENFHFSASLVEILSSRLGDADDRLGPVIRDFLEKKKQALCLFPKRWNRAN